MLQVSIPTSQFKQLEKAIVGLGTTLKKEASIAINATAKKLESFMAKEITSELAVAQKVVKSTIQFSRKANKDSLFAVIVLNKTRRIPLKEFKAKQTKKGVTYKISKTNKGRSIVAGGFIVERFSGNVFARRTKARGPIQSLKGPSPWGVFNKGDRKVRAIRFAREELGRQIQKRIRFLGLKRSGAISG